MKGPPFPVAESEVKRLFEGSFSVERLDSREVLAMNPRFIDKGLSELNEAVYLLSPKER
jgi:thiopurine S-methyltransferase